MAETDDGILTLLASWLLAHELADDWVRDAVERGPPEHLLNRPLDRQPHLRADLVRETVRGARPQVDRQGL